jgi:signal transduction histidine kinase
MLEFKGRHVSWETDRSKSDGSEMHRLYTSPPIETRMPFAGIRRAMDSMRIINRGVRAPLSMEMVKWGVRKSWRELAESNEFLRKKLFRNAEESFVANLRAKHEEVLKLLEELSQKNRELDRANSELMQLSNDLETLTHERTMSEIALKVADRIRNPATAIGGLALILLKKAPHDKGIREKLEAIFQEAKRLEKIVKDFDSLANAKSRSFEKVDLRDVVNSVLETLTPSFEQKNINLRIKMTDDPVTALINPQTIKVALLHILRNAVEASRREGIIEVTVWRRDGQPFISVRDFGPGIDTEVMEKLFRTSVTTKATGTGMGLMTVKQIMDEHKGSIEIKSGEEHGPGTEVMLLFPVRWGE